MEIHYNSCLKKLTCLFCALEALTIERTLACRCRVSNKRHQLVKNATNSSKIGISIVLLTIDASHLRFEYVSNFDETK